MDYREREELAQNRSPKPQEIWKELGHWEVPGGLGALNANDVTLAVFDARAKAAQKALSKLYRRVKACCDKHRGNYRRVVVRVNNPYSDIRVVGFRKETADEVRKRLERIAREERRWDDSERRHRLKQLQTLLSTDPESVRRALAQYNKDQAAKIVATVPEAAEAALEQ